MTRAAVEVSDFAPHTRSPVLPGRHRRKEVVLYDTSQT